MEITIKVTLNMEPWQAFVDALKREREGGPPNVGLRKALKQSAEVYRSWSKERYSQYSRGSGNWAALAESTIKQRRKGKSRKIKVRRGKKVKTKRVRLGTVAILIDNAFLIAGLDPQLNVGRGGYEQHIYSGIKVGYGGVAQHPETVGLTISSLAAIHQAGNPPDLPQRKIIVLPPERIMKRFATFVEKGLDEQWKRATA